MVAFRPSEAWHSDRPLDDGIAYAVITVHDGAITEMKGCATRESAEGYTTTVRTSAPRVNRVPPPDIVTSPPPLRVNRLIPFVHVTDVERSGGSLPTFGPGAGSGAIRSGMTGRSSTS
jgi:hypothetical protein